MTDYSVVPAPNYSAPIVNLFGQNNQQQGQQQQGPSFVQALQKFLHTGQGIGQQTGAPMQLQSAVPNPGNGVGQASSPYFGPVAPQAMPYNPNATGGLY